MRIGHLQRQNISHKELMGVFDMTKKVEVMTAPHGLRLERGLSIFKAKYLPVKGGGFEYNGKTVMSGTEYDVKISSIAQLTPNHGSLFDYAMALGDKGKKNSVTFNINEYLTACNKKTNESRNRKSIIKMVDDLQGLHMKIENENIRATFSLITGTFYDKRTGEITISFNREDIERYFEDAKVRYTNLSLTLPLKSGDLKEFLKFLQLNGRQLKAGGEPQWMKEFSIIQVAGYMHWSDENEDKPMDTILRTVGRMLETAQKEIAGFPKYHRRKCIPEIYKWVRE